MTIRALVIVGVLLLLLGAVSLTFAGGRTVSADEEITVEFTNWGTEVTISSPGFAHVGTSLGREIEGVFTSINTFYSQEQKKWGTLDVGARPEVFGREIDHTVTVKIGESFEVPLRQGVTHVVLESELLKRLKTQGLESLIEHIKEADKSSLWKQSLLRVIDGTDIEDMGFIPSDSVVKENMLRVPFPKRHGGEMLEFQFSRHTEALAFRKFGEFPPFIP